MALASIIGARYLAIDTADTELYVFAGVAAAVVISIRVFLFRGAGKRMDDPGHRTVYPGVLRPFFNRS